MIIGDNKTQYYSRSIVFLQSCFRFSHLTLTLLIGKQQEWNMIYGSVTWQCWSTFVELSHLELKHCFPNILFQHVLIGCHTRVISLILINNLQYQWLKWHRYRWEQLKAEVSSDGHILTPYCQVAVRSNQHSTINFLSALFPLNF